MVSESVASGASLPRGVGACIHTLPESVVSLIPWRPRCSEEAAVPVSGQSAVKEALFRREGRLLYATTDWRSLCRPISSISAVWQLSTASYFVLRTRGTNSASRARQGGRKMEKENFESIGCAWRARKLCGAAHWGGDLRAGEKVRERAGVAGARARRLSRTGDARGSLSSRCP